MSSKNTNTFRFDKALKYIIIVITLGLIVSMLWNYYQKTQKEKEQEKIIIEYASKPKQNDKERVVVSLWVDEKNVQNLDKTLASLLKQSVRVDMIYVNVAPKTSIKSCKLAEKCAIIQQAGKVYSNKSRSFLTILREKNAGVIIIELDVGGHNLLDNNSEYISQLLTNRAKETFLIYPGEEQDPKHPGVLNSLLSHNLEV